VNLETGALIKRIDFTGSPATPNGLSTATVANDSTGTATAIYAGDLRGNVWKVDVSSAAGAWATVPATPLSITTPFFSAIDTSGNVQPITAPITLGSNTAGGTMLYVGTGSYFTTADANYSGMPVNDTMYGLWDNNTTNILADKSELQQQTITAVTVAGQATRTLSNNAVPYVGAGAKRGWYINLVEGTNYQGERVAYGATLFDVFLLFTTIIPSNTDACAGGGTSWLMGVDAMTGGTSQAIFDLNGDGVFDIAAGVASTVGVFSKVSATVPSGGSAGLIGVGGATGTFSGLANCTLCTPLPVTRGRMSWRQLQ
jgi:type IV pilus assembly protein PilY1